MRRTNLRLGSEPQQHTQVEMGAREVSLDDLQGTLPPLDPKV